MTRPSRTELDAEAKVWFTGAMDTDRIRHLTDRLNEILGLPKQGMEQRAQGWCFGYIGNCSGIEGTPAFKDDRMWTVWAPHPGRVGTSGEDLGYVRFDDLDKLYQRLIGVVHFARVTQKTTAR